MVRVQRSPARRRPRGAGQRDDAEAEVGIFTNVYYAGLALTPGTPMAVGVSNPGNYPLVRVINPQDLVRGEGATGAGSWSRAGPHDLACCHWHTCTCPKSSTGCLRPSARPRGSFANLTKQVSGYERVQSWILEGNFRLITGLTG